MLLLITDFDQIRLNQSLRADLLGYYSTKTTAFHWSIRWALHLLLLPAAIMRQKSTNPTLRKRVIDNNYMTWSLAQENEKEKHDLKKHKWS